MMTWAIFGTTIVLLLLGFPMMIPLIEIGRASCRERV